MTDYVDKLNLLLDRYEQGEFIRNKEGSPLQRLVHDLVAEVGELKDRIDYLEGKVTEAAEAAHTVLSRDA